MRHNADGTRRNPIRTWLFNPFHYVAGGQAMALGIGAILLACLLGMLTTSHFDGVLDFHVGAKAPWWVYWVEGPVNWLIMSVLLLVGGKLLSRSQVRILDVFGTQALARFPTLIMALTQLVPPVRRVGQHLAEAATNMPPPNPASPLQPLTSMFAAIQPYELILFIVAVLLVLAMICWMVALMYRAYAVSCNVSGGAAIGVFVVLLIVGEIISKVLLLTLFFSASS